MYIAANAYCANLFGATVRLLYYHRGISTIGVIDFLCDCIFF